VNRARQSRKFKSAQNVFNVSLKELPENSPTFVCRLFRDVIKNVKQKMETQPNDYLRVNIDHPSLDSPVWIEFTQSKNLTEKILTKIESVQQSKKEFVLSDGGTQLDIFHVEYPQGSGGAKKKHLYLDKENFKSSKRAIVQIVNPWDYLCLPRALVVARLHAQKPDVPDPDFDKKWLRIRKGDVLVLTKKNRP
jgi:uncharacterized protein (DUF736 family)